MINNPDIQTEYSRGKSRDGRTTLYLRPAKNCFNRSRVVKGFNDAGINKKATQVIQEWYTPMVYYSVDGQVIGSNNTENALKEYWRVCDIEKRGQIFPVTEIK